MIASIIMSTPARARLNHGLRDAQDVCALTKVGTVLKYFRRKVLQFHRVKTVPKLGMSRFISVAKLSSAAPLTRTSHYPNLNFT